MTESLILKFLYDQLKIHSFANTQCNKKLIRDQLNGSRNSELYPDNSTLVL